MKIFATALILVGIWFGLATTGIIVDDSEHMGSSLRMPYSKDFIHDTINESKMDDEEKQILKSKIDEVIDLGKNGYELLIETTEKQLLSSLLMIISGIALLKQKGRSNQSSHTTPASAPR